MALLSIFKVMPRRTAVIHMAWLAALLLFFLAVILPIQRSAAGIDRQLREVREQIETQKMIQPFFQKLKAKSEAPPAAVLQLPASRKLSRDQVFLIPETLRKIARKTSLAPISITPDPSSLVSQNSFLLVNAVLRGDFMNFRSFLIALAELDYLEKVEEIAIQQSTDSMEFRVRLWLALD